MVSGTFYILFIQRVRYHLCALESFFSYIWTFELFWTCAPYKSIHLSSSNPEIISILPSVYLIAIHFCAFVRFDVYCCMFAPSLVLPPFTSSTFWLLSYNHQFINWWFIISTPKGYCYCSPKGRISQALLLILYKAVPLKSSFLDSSACSFIYF